MKVSHNGDLKMIELKYRAWDGGKYIYDLVISLSDGELSWLDMSLRGDEKGAWKSEGLERFTGLRDCKGVEIYEGDIYLVDGYGLAKVIIDPYHGVSFEGILNDWGGAVTLSHIIQMDLDYDRKGNIRQNKELLA